MNQNNLEENLKKYAEVITKIGVNIQPGQTVILYASVTQKHLANLITQAAYDLGANEVILEWNDSETTRAFLQHAPLERLSKVFDYEKEKWQFLADQRVSRISLISEDPTAFAGIDSDRIAAYQAAQTAAKRPIMQVTTNNDISWLVVAAADTKWAQMVFPELEAAEAVNKLWNSIFKITLIDQENPIAAWQNKISELAQHAAWLNDQAFTALHYKAPNTDITIGLPENHIWVAADSDDAAGNTFVANIPTEEVFTTPDFRRIDGVVSASKPLSYAGTLIEDIQLTFKNGQIIDAKAAAGEKVLKDLINTDDGSKSLGEVSLVPVDSPISASNILFYETLFDENASNHLAIGEAYPFTVEGGTEMNEEQLKEHGLNVSHTHVDFMVGSAQMDIDGIKKDGTTVPVFRNGNWTK